MSKILYDKKNPNRNYSEEAMQRYGALGAMRKTGVTVDPDPTFNKETTGVGSIEYFSPDATGRQSVIYPNGYESKHPKPGTHGIRFDPKTNDVQDVALDMLHGLPDDDAEYSKMRNDFKQRMLKYRGGDIDYYWRQKVAREGEGDGKEAFINNFVDGEIRNGLFEGTDQKFMDHRYSRQSQRRLENDPNLGKVWHNLKDYITTRGGRYAPGFKRGGVLYQKFQDGGDFVPTTQKDYKAKDIYDLFYGKYQIDPDKWTNAQGVISMHEGRGRRSQVQLGNGPGRGAWQIEPASAATMVKQYENIAKAHGFDVPKWLATFKKNAYVPVKTSDGKTITGYNAAMLGKPEQAELAMANFAYGKPNDALMKWRDGKASIGELWADGWKKSFGSNTADRETLMQEVNAGDTLSSTHVNKLLFDDLYVDPNAFDNPNKDDMVKKSPIIRRVDRKDHYLKRNGGILYKK